MLYNKGEKLFNLKKLKSKNLIPRKLC